ncbi:hypothetical protein ARAM_005648 [Aspergillus rambellii]|uniref:AGC-kinase C-terminal domain-containing protein n=1 Tax=Aspergillus rambellii TaxID=308745 RepID=A0A0F8WZW7_9EURO|nr:hypothetical protein ARAM_005648 [Aspergillus rambellii]
MPPSTVFSYWRRDHRRSSLSPVPPPVAQPTLKAAGVSYAPQLPLISDSTLTATFDETFQARDPSTLQTPTDYFSGLDGANTTNVTVSTIDAPASAITTLTVHAPSADDDLRPRSSPEERDREQLTLTAQSNFSQPSLTPLTPDQTTADSSKPNSPFRLSFGKGLRNPSPVENTSKRSTTPGMASSSHLRFRTSPVEASSGDRITPPQKEVRFEGPNGRRLVERDASIEQAQPIPHRPGKTMLHLLNPMSLLAKRRSSQIAALRAEDMNIGARNLVPAIPDDYDPRIRGNIVHDFSAPRPRRHLSAAPVLLHEAASEQPLQNGACGSPTGNRTTNLGVSDSAGLMPQPAGQRKRHSEYSPVFKEHFDDDEKVLQVGHKAYLQSSLLTDPSHRDPRAIPVFARKLPSSIPSQEKPPDNPPGHKRGSQGGSAVSEVAFKGAQDPDTVEIGQYQPSGLPKHFKSNASRFSFDMNGVGSSTQEKLLEEKHKEKEAARKAQARLEDRDYSDIDDDYDNDVLDDLHDFEEQIPGVNVDAEEYDDAFKGFSGPGNLINQSWLVPDLSPVVASPVNPSENPNLHDDQVLPSSTHEELETSATNCSSSSSLHNTPHQAERATASPHILAQGSEGLSTAALELNQDEEDDDLYFDDGEFGELDTEEDGEKFDESIFDDPTSHLYERKPVTGSVTTSQSIISAHEELDRELVSDSGLKHVPSMASDYRGTSLRRVGGIAENVRNQGSVKAHNGVLSEHNLEAFHNALADAATQAAAKGRFGHTTSVSERSLGQESSTHTVDSQPGLISDDSRLSQTVDVVSFDEVFEDFNYDDSDDLFYDDPIIAAANAEALENDDEGFYGQEFGFYAQASGHGFELTNGGYFGPRGVEGISRSHSGRGKFREPSLTPITERSEWSTRNSIISVTAHGAAHSNQSVSGPGLAQLVDMGNLDDEMSLSALLRLRRGAWGGSNGSLRSSSGSPPPHQHSASNRGSLALSDVSPTVHTVPPDFLGAPVAIDPPIKESEKGAWLSALSQPRLERATTGDGEA